METEPAGDDEVVRTISLWLAIQFTNRISGPGAFEREGLLITADSFMNYIRTGKHDVNKS